MTTTSTHHWPTLGPVRDGLRRVPGAIRFVRAVRGVEYWFTLRFARRRNYVFTKFCRLPTQLDVLADDVIDFLRAGDERRSEIRIIVFGCSIGAEPYSIASVLQTRHPDVRVRMECFDIDPSVIARAQSATYSMPELSTRPPLTPAFVAATFEQADAGVVVKPSIAESVRFAQGDLLDAALIQRLGRADVVVAQNVLYHLTRRDAERAFAHLFSLMKPRAALLIDGADLDLRSQLTKAAGLRPCTTALERIHNESRVERGYAWPRVYWGLEPFNQKRRDAARRFATIFFSER